MIQLEGDSNSYDQEEYEEILKMLQDFKTKGHTVPSLRTLSIAAVGKLYPTPGQATKLIQSKDFPQILVEDVEHFVKHGYVKDTVKDRIRDAKLVQHIMSKLF